MIPNYLSFFKANSLQDTYKAIVDEAMRLTGAKYGSLFLYRDKDLYRVYASTNTLFQIVPRRKGATWTTFKKHSEYLFQAESGQINPKTIKLLSVQTDIAVTLIDGNKPLGMLTVMSKKPQRLTRKDFNTIKQIQPWASIAIKQAMQRYDLESAIKSYDLFISLTSHELKSPMTSIFALSQMLERAIKQNKEINPDIISKLIINEKRLVGLVDDLLFMSRMRKGEYAYNMQKNDLRAILNRAIVEFGYSYPKHNIEIVNKIQDKRITILADFDKIIQVFVNILNNAGKYSQPSSTITITLSKTANSYTVEIRDEGIGIEKEYLDKLFVPFSRSESTQSLPGLGVGLYLTKQILDAHNAKIAVLSELNKGTSVTVTFKK